MIHFPRRMLAVSFLVALMAACSEGTGLDPDELAPFEGTWSESRCTLESLDTDYRGICEDQFTPLELRIRGDGSASLAYVCAQGFCEPVSSPATVQVSGTLGTIRFGDRRGYLAVSTRGDTLSFLFLAPMHVSSHNRFERARVTYRFTGASEAAGA